MGPLSPSHFLAKRLVPLSLRQGVCLRHPPCAALLRRPMGAWGGSELAQSAGRPGHIPPCQHVEVRWNTLCPAEAPQLDTTRNSSMPRSRVTLLMTSKQWATTAEFSGVISPQEAMWALGITRKWVGAWGSMS